MNSRTVLRNFLLFAGIGVFCQCAYVNTFYNAQVAFNTAHKEHLKFLRTRVDTSEVVPDKVMTGYERAIQKSVKTMDVYPQATKWHDDAIFLMGKAAYFRREYDDAIRRMRRLQREFPESPFVAESFLYLGKAYLENDNLAKAEETLRLILAKYPHLNSNEEITLLLAEVAIKREGKAQAIELLVKTLQSVTAIDKKIEIHVKIASLYIELKQYDRAIQFLKKAPRRKEFPQLLYQIDFALLTCHIGKAEHASALALIDVMLKNKEYFTFLNEILLKQGLIFSKQGKTDEAVGVFERITKDESGSKAVRGQAWFELGLIYQHVKGDFEKARECYQQAGSLATDTEIQRVAMERMQAISGLKGMTEAATVSVKDSVAADSARPIDLARYKLGETYWLLLKEPDSALHYFRQISTDPHADSSMVIKGLFAEAWILRHLKNDSLKADSLFQAIITASPTSIYAQKSQKELGREVTILTRADSARMAFIDAEELYFDKGDAVAATNGYLRVYKSYPDLPDVAGRSLYAAAWLCDHALYKKKVSAQRFYTLLCDSFPQSEWCLNEAKPRLKVFRDSLTAWEARRGSEPQAAADADALQEPDAGQDAHAAPEGPAPSTASTPPSVAPARRGADIPDTVPDDLVRPADTAGPSAPLGPPPSPAVNNP